MKAEMGNTSTSQETPKIVTNFRRSQSSPGQILPEEPTLLSPSPQSTTTMRKDISVVSAVQCVAFYCSKPSNQNKMHLSHVLTHPCPATPKTQYQSLIPQNLMSPTRQHKLRRAQSQYHSVSSEPRSSRTLTLARGVPGPCHSHVWSQAPHHGPPNWNWFSHPVTEHAYCVCVGSRSLTTTAASHSNSYKEAKCSHMPFLEWFWLWKCTIFSKGVQFPSLLELTHLAKVLYIFHLDFVPEITYKLFVLWRTFHSVNIMNACQNLRQTKKWEDWKWLCLLR